MPRKGAKGHMVKLVRDLVPEQLTALGVQVRVEALEGIAFREALRAKLAEEVAEYLAAATDDAAVSELGDVLEVILALASEHGSDARQVECVRMAKRAARGGFDRRLRATIDD